MCDPRRSAMQEDFWLVNGWLAKTRGIFSKGWLIQEKQIPRIRGRAGIVLGLFVWASKDSEIPPAFIPLLGAWA